jgi:glutamate-1-semialdehyde aminotransferase
LRSILQCADVACVVPGTASVEEADENARAGHASVATPERSELRTRLELLQTTLCSRCGLCDERCSQKLPVSWMFRAGYVALNPSETFETWDEVEYFRLHPKPEAVCATCPDVTCGCPHGVDVPRSLTHLHADMVRLREQGLVAAPADETPVLGGSDLRARVLQCDVPSQLTVRTSAVGKLFVENAGTRSWFPEKNPHRSAVALELTVGSGPPTRVFARHEIHPGGRGHFVFEVTAPPHPTRLPLRAQLLAEWNGFSRQNAPVLFDGAINVVARVPEISEPTPRPVSAPPYAVEWIEHNLPEEWPEGAPLHAYVRFANRGSRLWRARHPEGKQVVLAVSIEGGPLHGVHLPRDINPGEEVTLGLPLTLSGTECQGWTIQFALVEQNVAWFADKGALNLRVSVRRAPPRTGATQEALAVARVSNNWGYQPTQGIACGRDGQPYPLFVREAKGCRVRDPDGHEWIDYVMGWGAALLGYAHPEVQAAVAPYLGTGAVLGLPHELEMQLTAELCARFPGTDAALFGKNGSDVCTAAVRIARAYTGRHTVLFSGYHGWQDWYAEAAAPELAAPGSVPSAHRFRFNDLGDFCQLIEKHRGQVAAVVLEPAAQVEGVDGPVRDADPAFLRHVADVCRTHGILLVFDEIMTGFRYRGGSVRHATGVVPDLLCLGKALTSGWPLSALLGRREVLAPTMGRAFYHPTFRGEIYSLAAARAALVVYARDDVPARIHAFGTRLMTAVTRVSAELGVAGRMVGLPYRMVYRFDEPDGTRRALKRTLLIQELMKNGVLTFRGFLLPSLAHGDEELARTLEAYRAALRAVRDADADGSFARRLEIPLVT